ncbi:MAG: hypothetical protein GC179_30335 [Anaerolineaceae bacterium]|nr:hypothetical protein [Anaerolineaceae bacterium]
MSESQAERAVNQLYDSDTLRSELRDEEASLLLSWGEARISELAEMDLPDSEFDRLTDGMRALLTAINVCVGKRKTSPSQLMSMMATISSTAEAAGYTLPESDQTTFLQHQGGLANQDTISELLGLLRLAEAPQPPDTVSAEAAAEAQPPAAVNDLSGELKTVPLNPISVYNVGEQTPEISGSQTDEPTSSGTENIPPQPEDLPEFPPQSSQES